MFENKFNVSHVCTMQYNSIISAIAKFLRLFSFTKEMYCYTIGPIILLYYEQLFFYKKCTNIIYKNINTKDKTPASVVRWNSEISLNGYLEKNTKDVFKICFNVTKDSAAQWFKYRILHRILPVKNYPKNIKATDNDDCTFCGNSAETIEHIFVSCSHSLAMWNQFSIHIYNTTSN